MIYAMSLLFDAKAGATVHFATVCSSWVIINRGTSRRSVANPLGRQELPYIQRANIMASRSALLALLCMCLGLDWIIEQPASSLLFEHPRLRQIFDLASSGGTRVVQRASTWMGCFGAPTPKPTILVGTPVWLPSLARKFVRNKFQKRHNKHMDIVTYKVVKGRKFFTGGSKLKKTQEYPLGYGQAAI